MTRHLADVGQFPGIFARQVGRRAPFGLLVMAALTILMVLALDLNSIASLGSAVALLIFSAVTIAHFKVYRRTGANLIVLILGLIATLGTFVVFTMTTLVNEPRTALALIVILVFATAFDFAWKGVHARRTRGQTDEADHETT